MDERDAPAHARAVLVDLELDLDGRRAPAEVEFEVDQNRAGVPWRVTLRRNGAVVAATRAVTRAPSGSFTVRLLIADGAGPDRVTALATSPTGERCAATATW